MRRFFYANMANPVATDYIPREQRMTVKNPELLQLYSAATPNGLKVAIMMEELHERLTLKGKTFHYEDHELNLSALETRKLDYLRLCPNGKIPMIIDRTPDNQTITVWESGAILLYLGEKYHEMVPMENIYDRAEALKWLFWASASLSPQAKAFGFYYTHCPQTLPYCINRYAKEVDRLLGVLEMQLKHGHHWIVGGEFTVADVATFPWIHCLYKKHIQAHPMFNNFKDYPLVMEWYHRCVGRPAVDRGLKLVNII